MMALHLLHSSAFISFLLGSLLAATTGVSGAQTRAAETDPKSLPKTVDLLPLFAKYELPNRRQGGRGTCSVFATVGGLEYALAVKNGHGARLSVEFLNWAAHKAANRTADGGFFSELWNGYEKSGICTEEDLPYQSQYNADLNPPELAVQHASIMCSPLITLQWIKEWNPNTGLTPTQIAAIKSTIARRWPVLGGFRWPKRAEWKQGVLQMCPPEEVFDGHSVLLIGFRDDATQPGGGVFMIRNSGGDGSDGYLPYAYVAEFMNDAAWIFCVGKTPAKLPLNVTKHTNLEE